MSGIMTVPEELDEIMEEALAAEEARDAVITRSFFKFQLRNAVHLGKIGRKRRREFWKGVVALYPDLAGKPATYNRTDMIIEGLDT